MKNIDKILSDSPFYISSIEEMTDLGELLGSHLESGDSIALIGDLGAGKTHFTKGVVKGVKSFDPVSSPTFPIVHEYHSGTLPILHFDFYRLESPAELDALGWDEYVDSGGAIIAEWADKFPDWMPEGTLWLHFRVTSPTERTIYLSRSPEL